MTNANGAAVNIKGLTNSTLGAKAGMLALRGAAMLANTIISVGLSMAISFVISKISEWINKEDELRKSTIETANKAKEEADNIQELYSIYTQTDAAYKNNSTSKENLTSATDNLLEALGIEKSELSDLIQKYGDLDSAIKNVTVEALNEKLVKLRAGYVAYQDDIVDAVDDINDQGILGGYEDYQGNTPETVISLNRAEESKITDLLKQLGYYKNGASTHEQETAFISFDFDTDSAEGAYKAYCQLEEILLRINDEVQKGNITQNDLDNSPAYKKISGVFSELENNESLKNYKEYASEINKTTAKLRYIEYTNANGVPETREEYDKLFSDLISWSEKFKGSFIGSNKQIKDSIINMLGDIPELANFVMPDSIEDNNQKVIASYKEISEAYKSVQKITTRPKDNSSFKPIDDYAKQLGIATGDFKKSYEKFDKIINKDFDIKNWFDNLSAYNQNLAFKIGVETNDADLWTLDKWKEELIAVSQTGKTTEEQIQSFYDIMNSTEDGNFSSVIEGNISKLTELSTALTTLKTSGMSDNDILNLAIKYPELTPYINDTEGLKNAIVDLIDTSQEGINSELDSQIKALGEDAPEAAKAFEMLKDSINGIYDESKFDFDITSEIEKFNNLWTAVGESASATGLTTESIDKLKAKYQDLEGYNPVRLFEKTTNGIHLNVQSIRDLEKEYNKQKYDKLNNQLTDLTNQYLELTNQIDRTSDASKRSELYNKRNDIKNQIEDVSILAAQYQGLISSFNAWTKAQETADEDDMFTKLSSGLESIQELYNSGRVGTDDFREAVQLMTDTDLSSSSTEEIVAMYENGIGTMQKFFTGNQEGLQSFLDTAKSVSDELGKTWVQIDDSGNYVFDFGIGGDSNLAEAINQMTDLQMSTEQVQILLRALSSYGYEINLDSLYSVNKSLDELKTNAEKANDKLIELGKTDFVFKFDEDNSDKLNSQLEEAKRLYDSFKDSDGKVNLELEGAKESKDIFEALIRQKLSLEQPVIMSLDMSTVESDYIGAVELLQQFQRDYEELQVLIDIGGNTSKVESDIQGVVTEINGLSPEVKAKIGFNDEAVQNALNGIQNQSINVEAGLSLSAGAISTIQSSISNIDVKSIQVDDNSNEVENNLKSINQTNVDDKSFDVRIRNLEELHGTIQAIQDKKIDDKYFNIYSVNSSKVPNGYATGNKSGNSKVDGTAFSRGSWGTKDSGTALVGELGQEILVHEGRYTTIGDNGAEFINYKRGDIIFNAEQTKQLLSNGKITNGKRRGRAFSNGTVSGLAFSSGSGGFYGNKNSSSNSSGNSSGSSNKSSSSSSADKANEKAKDFEETIDWIEIKIDRVERAIDSLNKKAESVYHSWSYRNGNLIKEISSVKEEIDIQQKAYQRYLKEANSVGLDKNTAKDVREGKIDITKIKDEDLSNKIKDYQKWYEKAIDARDAVIDLTETVSSLYSTVFDNIEKRFDDVMSTIEHEQNMINEYITQTEERGYIVNTKLYEELQSQERQNISNLEKERIELTAAMNNAVNSGALIKGSEEWVRMSQKIRDVTLEIEKGTTELIKYAKAIRDIKWDTFDLIEERVSNITTETDFLINLLDDEKLFTDKGAFTNQGNAVLGLHLADYNIYMSQADDYAKEILELNKQLADDPANVDLANRRDELLKLQQQSILSAKDEKSAVVDLVKEGIELELQSLKDLIDTYKESLDSAKDLYDYQNKVKDQTSEIASIQKQLSAYSGDTSEETRTTVQKLKVSLEDAKKNLQETEYDKYISDQQKMLDKLYLDYETAINKRLDDVNALIKDMIATTNQNASDISSVIYNAAGDVGYTLSEASNKIWGDAYQSIQEDSNKRYEQVNSALQDLISSGEITQQSANAILNTLKNGDITNAEQTLSIVEELQNNGVITNDTAQSIISSLNTNNPKAALESLKLIDKLVANGEITSTQGSELKTAIATNGAIITSSIMNTMSNIASSGLATGKDIGNLLSSIDGGLNVLGITNIENAIDEVKQLYSDNAISKSDADTLINSIITGNSKDSKDIIGRLVVNDAFQSTRIGSIIAAIGANPNGTDISSINTSVSTVKDLLSKGIIDEEQAKRFIEDITNGDSGRFIKEVQALKDVKAIDDLTYTRLINGVIEGNVSTVEKIKGENGDVITKITTENGQTIESIVDKNGNIITKITDEYGNLVSATKEVIGENGNIISRVTYMTDEYGRTITSIDGLTRSVNDLINKKPEESNIKVVVEYSKEFDNIMTTIKEAINSIKNNTDKLLVGDIDSSGSVNVRDAAKLANLIATGKSSVISNEVGDVNGDGKVNVRDVAKIANSVANGKSLTSNTANTSKVFGDINGDGVVNTKDVDRLSNLIANKQSSSLSKEIADINGDGVINTRDLTELKKKLQAKGFASGARRISSDELAWTQENGAEYIIRPSDGAILTPLAKNDSVLNSLATDNIWSMANNPTKFIKDNLKSNSEYNVPAYKSVANTYTGDTTVSINLPNVTNYNEFKYAMQHDKSVENFIRAVSTDRMFGKSSLRKYKV